MIEKKTRKSTGNTHEITPKKGMAKNRKATALDGAVVGAITSGIAKKKRVTQLNKAVRMTVKESQAKKKEESWRRK